MGSKTVKGKAWLDNRIQDFTYLSYMICCNKGDVWGDGVTPLECALGGCSAAAAVGTGRILPIFLALFTFTFLFALTRRPLFNV